ncbi:hypothetical protein AB0758_43770 [Tolypothrix bouteillei VB521301_2]|uniref:hypothetical protein n=1 Tax=Tolypothrix bouteillei TaxID=1246981 RepID=UPI0038B45C11
MIAGDLEPQISKLKVLLGIVNQSKTIDSSGIIITIGVEKLFLVEQDITTLWIFVVRNWQLVLSL